MKKPWYNPKQVAFGLLQHQRGPEGTGRLLPVLIRPKAPSGPRLPDSTRCVPWCTMGSMKSGESSLINSDLHPGQGWTHWQECRDSDLTRL